MNDIRYKFALNDAFDFFAGSAFTYNSRMNSSIGSPAVPTIDDFTLPGLQAGVETSDGKYRFTLRGKNVTDNYHWSSTFLGFDTVTRFVAPPATYGISLSGRFRRPERRGETGCSRPYA
ncbi:hypothetical protein QQ987_13030 [Sphingobium baderi]|nr:hypothetical protein QQ987_13030 [Sphingobium baderi]